MSNKSSTIGAAIVEGYVNTLLQEEMAGEPKPAEPTAATRSLSQRRNLPPWAAHAFQLTLFHSGELMFALVLREISGVLDIKGSWLLPAEQNKPDWLVGTVSFEGRKIAVIDPYNLILPQPYRSVKVAAPTTRISRVFIVGEGRLAIAMDRLEKVVTFRAQDVVWRGAPGQRPWLRGVVRQPRCALLDSDELAGMLAECDIVV